MNYLARSAKIFRILQLYCSIFHVYNLMSENLNFRTFLGFFRQFLGHFRTFHYIFTIFRTFWVYFQTILGLLGPTLIFRTFLGFLGLCRHPVYIWVVSNLK